MMARLQRSTGFILRVLLVSLFLICGAKSDPNEGKLMNDLLEHYNTLERPVEHIGNQLKVKFGMTLDAIDGLDIGFNKLTVNVKHVLEWEDFNLRWNTSDYAGISVLKRVPDWRIWFPDIKIREEASGEHDVMSYTHADVTNTGKLTYMAPREISTPKCRLDTGNFPFDEHACDFVFSSWNYDKDELDLVLFEKNATNLADFQQNEYWKLIDFTAKREVIAYSYFPSGPTRSKPTLTFTVKVRRNGEGIYALLVFLASLNGFLLLFSRFFLIRGGRVWFVIGIFVPILFALYEFNPQYNNTEWHNFSHTENVILIIAKLTLFVLICDILMNYALRGEDSAEAYYGALISKTLPIQEKLDTLLWFVPSGLEPDKLGTGHPAVPNNTLDSSSTTTTLRPLDNNKNSNLLLVSVFDRVLFILIVVMVGILLMFCLPGVPSK